MTTAEESKVKTSDFLKKAVEQVGSESFPTDVTEKEKYFMEQVAKGESLLAEGESGYLEAAVSFYKALKIYPDPAELIKIYQKTIPEAIFTLVDEMMRIEVTNPVSEE